VLCPLADAGACPGVVANALFASQNGDGGEKITRVCATGYKDSACALCDEGYYMSENRCWSCGSDSSSQAYFALMVIVAFGLVVLLSVSVAVLRAEHLAQVVTAVIVVQNVVQVGKSGSTTLPDSAQFIAEFFNAASVVNFDIQYFKPGCTGPVINFLQLFWYTFLLLVSTGACFFLACVVRRLLRLRIEAKEIVEEKKRSMQRSATIEMMRQQSLAQSPEEKQKTLARIETEMRLEQEKKARDFSNAMYVSPQSDFHRRLLHSLLILLSIYYLKLTTLCVRGLVCSTQPDPAPLDGSTASTSSSLYLVVDSSIRCYESYHAATVAFIFIFFLVYVIGFPVFCFVRAHMTPPFARHRGCLVYVPVCS
jgi:hypothetical protein